MLCVFGMVSFAFTESSCSKNWKSLTVMSSDTKHAICAANKGLRQTMTITQALTAFKVSFYFLSLGCVLRWSLEPFCSIVRLQLWTQTRKSISYWARSLSAHPHAQIKARGLETCRESKFSLTWLLLTDLTAIILNSMRQFWQ